MSGSRKPVLALTTPISASFPADALKAAATPCSATWRDSLASAGLPSAGLPSAGLISPAIAALKTEDGFKTPISPPVAYMDFLKFATSPTVVSPPPTTSNNTMSKNQLNRTSTAGSLASVQSNSTTSSSSTEGDEKEIDSAPSTATSEGTDCDCDCDHVHKSPMTAATRGVPPSPFGAYPMSAPPTGPTTFPSLKVPASPAVSNHGGDTPIVSPYSARSVRSPFDWEAALKARKFGDTKGTHHSGCGKSSAAAQRTSVRHIREVVTRTVTYTPRMEPAPKGKRRKVE